MDLWSPTAVEHGSPQRVEETVPMSIHAVVDNLDPEVQSVKTWGVQSHNGVQMQGQVSVDVEAQCSLLRIACVPEDVSYESRRPRSFCRGHNKTKLPGGKG